MIDEPPPLPSRPPELAPRPLPPPRRRPRWPLALLPVAGLIALYLGPLRVEVAFVDDVGQVPGPFEVTLSSGRSRKEVTVEKGRLHLIRGRWTGLEVTDDSYVRSRHPVRGGKVTIERNALLRLRQAAIGNPSVPQRGDPDPRND